MADSDDVLATLRAEIERHPEIADTISLYCRVLEIQQRAEIAARPPALSADEARERLRQGRPLLDLDQFDIDAASLTEVAMQIAFAIAELRRDRVRDLALVHAWLHNHRDKMKSVAIAFLKGQHIPNGSNNGVDHALLAFVLHAALQPFLRAEAKALAHFVETSTWYRAPCPICGGEPDMAALKKNGGRRTLLCSRCDAEWTYRRLGCPFCGNDDPKELAFFPSDDKVYRLAVCERCHRYIKTVDLRETPTERPLAAERVLTAAMDVTAQQTGYRATG
jgi:formate dehydrogenase accessory protein FdhE